MLPVPTLPDATLPTFLATHRAVFRRRQGARKTGLYQTPASPVIRIPGGQGPDAMQMFGYRPGTVIGAVRSSPHPTSLERRSAKPSAGRTSAPSAPGRAALLRATNYPLSTRAPLGQAFGRPYIRAFGSRTRYASPGYELSTIHFFNAPPPSSLPYPPPPTGVPRDRRRTPWPRGYDRRRRPPRLRPLRTRAHRGPA